MNKNHPLAKCVFQSGVGASINGGFSNDFLSLAEGQSPVIRFDIYKHGFYSLIKGRRLIVLLKVERQEF